MAARRDDGRPAAADETLERIRQVIALGQQGRRAEARAAFGEIWAALGPGGDPLHRCFLAHSMADVQDDPQEELAWDQRALEVAESVTDERAAAAGAIGPVAAFYPSLHLNVGEDHRRLGNLAEARRHLDLGLRAAPALGDDPYGALITKALDDLAARLSAEGTPPDAGG
ncbi:hypothetical protein ACI782_03070 [Geodermatophilus sp. SYSU D00703]